MQQLRGIVPSKLLKMIFNALHIDLATSKVVYNFVYTTVGQLTCGF